MLKIDAEVRQAVLACLHARCFLTPPGTFGTLAGGAGRAGGGRAVRAVRVYSRVSRDLALDVALRVQFNINCMVYNCTTYMHGPGIGNFAGCPPLELFCPTPLWYIIDMYEYSFEMKMQQNAEFATICCDLS